MPRRREVPKRKIIPDPKYKDKLVSKFTNTLMFDGGKAVAEGIPVLVYNSGRTTWKELGAIGFIGEDPWLMGNAGGKKVLENISCSASAGSSSRMAISWSKSVRSLSTSSGRMTLVVTMSVTTRSKSQNPNAVPTSAKPNLEVEGGYW